jgi:hypothetical protein
MLHPNLPAQWKKIVAAGLYPDITTFTEYEHRFRVNLTLAYDLAAENPILLPQASDLQAAHRLIFNSIHPWAGEFRSKAVHFDAGFLGADAHRIPEELESIRTAMLPRSEMLESPHDKAMFMVEYQSRLRRIHPFLDGNTRTGTVMLEAQTAALFGVRERPPLAGLDFKHLIRSTYKGDYTQFVNQIFRREGLPAEDHCEGPKPAPQHYDTDLETAMDEAREKIRQTQLYGKQHKPNQ